MRLIFGSTWLHVVPVALAPLLLFLLMFCGADVGANELEPCSPAIWMECAPLRVRHRPLLSLALPGSHNSFAYWLDDNPDVELAPDIAQWQIDLLSALSLVWDRQQLRSMFREWSLTQSLDVEQQLEAGVRYFDIRIAFDPKSNTLRFVHMLWGRPVYEELDKLNAFLLRHRREVVILDFNHFYRMTSEHHQQLTSYLLGKFGKRLISRRWGRLSWLTLHKLRPKGLQVIVIYHSQLEPSSSQFHFWPGNAIANRWPDTDQVDDMVRFLDKRFQNRTETFFNFFVYQGVLTPNAGLVASRFGSGSLRSELAMTATPAFVSWLQTLIPPSVKRKGVSVYSPTSPSSSQYPLEPDPSYYHKLGICSADFVDIANFTVSVIELNY